VEIRDNVSHIATTRSRVDVYFAYAHGALTVIGNDFDGACAPYVAGEDVGPVTASGNKTSTCT